MPCRHFFFAYYIHIHVADYLFSPLRRYFDMPAIFFDAAAYTVSHGQECCNISTHTEYALRFCFYFRHDATLMPPTMFSEFRFR